MLPVSLGLLDFTKLTAIPASFLHVCNHNLENIAAPVVVLLPLPARDTFREGKNK